MGGQNKDIFGHDHRPSLKAILKAHCCKTIFSNVYSNEGDVGQKNIKVIAEFKELI